ncbi:hypothetical protein HHI36_008731 [Cryptolaemus montrouzieri]|uniref:DUF4789 domain-containing protein n=1 Tax=Cryptolaemus montrouzieri TaxID=559131 RepID=A0ABD2MTA3_9CUCU
MKCLVLLWSVILYGQIWGQDIIFSTDDEDSDYSRFKPEITNIRSTTHIPSTTIFQRRPTERPKPIRDPEKCPGNQLYYPGEPWFCDCGPKYIYYKPKDECYHAYMKGPCLEGKHLVVKKRNVQCVRNPCPEEYVRYNGKCYQLEKSDGPCEKINGTTAILKINPDTLAVECKKTTADELTLFSFPDRCPPGSKRDANNKCRENWNV